MHSRGPKVAFEHSSTRSERTWGLRFQIQSPRMIRAPVDNAILIRQNNLEYAGAHWTAFKYRSAFMDPLLLAIIIAFVLALASSSSYSAPEKPPPRSKPKDTPILLISGRIDDPNIKDIDANAQTLLKKDNLAFSQAVAYDRQTLLKMKQHPVPSKEQK
jgi:hypothetical protein